MCTLFLLFAAVFFLPDRLIASIPEVQITHLQQIQHIETVSASGVIEEAEKNAVILDTPVVPDQICVKIGDYVEEGQLLATIDRGQTIRSLQSLGESMEGGSSITGLDPSLLTVLAGASLDKSAQEAVADLSASIPSRITAACSGTVTGLGMKEGELAFSDTAAVTISDLDHLIASLAVKEKDIAAIEVGQTVELSGTGFKGKSCTGIVSEIYPTARKRLNGLATETVVDVIVELTQTNAAVKPGFSVEGSIQTSSGDTIYILPYECILQDERGTEYVYVCRNGQAVRQDITVGLETIQGAQITAGLSAEDAVIYNAAEVDPGSPLIRIAEGME